MYGRTPEPVPAECNEWATSWPTLLQSLQPDVAMVQFGPWDVVDHRLPGDSTWRAPGDPTYDAFLAGEMRTAMDVFHAAGVPLVWLTAPDIEIGRNEVPPPADPYPGSDPARMHRFNELLRETAAGRADVRIVDLNGYLGACREARWMRTFGLTACTSQRRPHSRQSRPGSAPRSSTPCSRSEVTEIR